MSCVFLGDWYTVSLTLAHLLVFVLGAAALGGCVHRPKTCTFRCIALSTMVYSVFICVDISVSCVNVDSTDPLIRNPDWKLYVLDHFASRFGTTCQFMTAAAIFAMWTEALLVLESPAAVTAKRLLIVAVGLTIFDFVFYAVMLTTAFYYPLMIINTVDHVKDGLLGLTFFGLSIFYSWNMGLMMARITQASHYSASLGGRGSAAAAVRDAGSSGRGGISKDDEGSTCSMRAAACRAFCACTTTLLWGQLTCRSRRLRLRSSAASAQRAGANADVLLPPLLQQKLIYQTASDKFFRITLSATCVSLALAARCTKATVQTAFLLANADIHNTENSSVSSLSVMLGWFVFRFIDGIFPYLAIFCLTLKSWFVESLANATFWALSHCCCCCCCSSNCAAAPWGGIVCCSSCEDGDGELLEIDEEEGRFFDEAYDTSDVKAQRRNEHHPQHQHQQQQQQQQQQRDSSDDSVAETQGYLDLDRIRRTRGAEAASKSMGRTGGLFSAASHVEPQHRQRLLGGASLSSNSASSSAWSLHLSDREGFRGRGASPSSPSSTTSSLIAPSIGGRTSSILALLGVPGGGGGAQAPASQSKDIFHFDLIAAVSTGLLTLNKLGGNEGHSSGSSAATATSALPSSASRELSFERVPSLTLTLASSIEPIE